MSTTARAVELTEKERVELERRSRSQTARYRDVLRAKIILSLAAGGTIKGTARELHQERRIVRKWQRRFKRHGLFGLVDLPRRGRAVIFAPAVATHLVKLACELPDTTGRSLSLWTCSQLAITLAKDGTVESISPQTVHRILTHHTLKPWRVHHWLSPKVPRDAAFKGRVLDIMGLYTRPYDPHELVFSIDEKTSLQPRTRTCATRPPQPGNVPARLEHEYVRKGALQLFAAFNTHTGKVVGILRQRKRQVEYIELLEELDAQTPQQVHTIHIIADNVSVHHGKQVRAWLAKHPRFRTHFTPVHCSWMNQVEQWFSILQRRRLTAANFADLSDLECKVLRFIDEWNEHAHPFRWSAKSFDKVLATIDARLPMAA